MFKLVGGGVAEVYFGWRGGYRVVFKMFIRSGCFSVVSSVFFVEFGGV